MNSIIKISTFVLILTLTSCVTAPPQQKCPQLTMNSDQPDYMQSYDYQTLGEFYSCTNYNLDLKYKTDGFGFIMSSPDYKNPDYYMRKAALDYQWKLWQQIENRQLTHAQAEQAWINFNNMQLAQWAPIVKQREEDEAEAAQAQANADTQADADFWAQVQADTEEARRTGHAGASNYPQ